MLPELEDVPAPQNRLMVVNEVPGEECRIAILDKNRLDEYFVERASSATVVGNIYKARVTNVEPAIQAAFVDFGLGESGFLHVSDLHPRYFPGEGLVEQVGKKIPRRQRPPIQDALKKGQEILVQVLKQGIGSKGPTLTSYLSIPGRLMVMMPQMDRVGVSRKVADDDQRRSMREVLDSLDLPDGFGFIVRTAGFEASKTELKRDVAYLKRLWQQMDRRMKNTGAPCLLYAESDLLVRTIRDVVDSSVSWILVDDPAAFERASGFLKVAAPRSAPEIRYYDRSMPIFTAFDVERQIDQIHDEAVPLISGGALVIQQTEALVAIDVNSGRSRSARDSETNAFETNIEAVDEISRQLRLRDLGGLIINDLIDMRHARHRLEIEARFLRNFKRDRAKTTVLPISEFGIVEMTRQRMRPNTRRAHYQPCLACSGSGELLRADAVAADALRRVAVMLGHDSASSVELVCSSEVASILTNDRRQEIARLEEHFGKKLDVRVSETIANDRVDFYAYDAQGADLDTSSTRRPKAPNIEELPLALDESARESVTGGKKTGKRKRRRRGKTEHADATAIALAGGFNVVDDDDDDAKAESSTEQDPTQRKKRRQRGGRSRRKKDTTEAATDQTSESIRIYALAKELGTTSREILDRCVAESDIKLKNHMSTVAGAVLGRIRNWFTAAPDSAPESAEATPTTTEGPATDVSTDGPPEKRRRRRRRGRRGRGRKKDSEAEATVDASPSDQPETPTTEASEERTPEVKGADHATSDASKETSEGPPKKRRRRRGGRRRRKDNNQEAPETKSQVEDEVEPESAPEATITEPTPSTAPAPTAPPDEPSIPKSTPPAQRKPRTLYGGRFRRVGAVSPTQPDKGS